MLVHIVAVGSDLGIGKGNDLLWRIPEDLAQFKKLTTCKTIIMGRKTFESLPKVLPEREHIVLTRNKSYVYKHPQVTVMHDLESVITKYANSSKEVFVIGGGELYLNTLPFTDKIYLTKVYGQKDADTYYPDISKEYEILTHSDLQTSVEGGVQYEYLTLVRKVSCN